MKKRWELYFVFALLAVSFVTAGQVMQLKFDFYQNGNVFLKGFDLAEGNPPEPQNEIGDYYTLQIFDEKGNPLYQQRIKPAFLPGSSTTSLFLEVAYEENYDTITLKKGDRLYIRKPIHALLCNLDQECNNFETPKTCAEDCAPQTLKTCTSAADSTCDSRCPADPDCQTNSSVNWMYFLLVLMITGLVIFGLTEYKRIKAKHALLQKLNLPSQAAIGFAPAKVTPASGQSTSNQANKPS